MQRRLFGATGRMVAAVGFGTWYLEQAPHAAAVAALRHGLDRGMSHIDTAELYGSGRAEELVGE
ncbi:MAG: aldo/keto reductase, partial [Alphaproteobacteria bacterium]|nr:aldo/keto reductase [Alphaproteobacteria bacterium]